MMPECLVLNECSRDLVVGLDDLFRLFCCHDAFVGLKLLHGVLDSAKKLTRPAEIASHWWRVARSWGRIFLLIVNFLHGLEIQPIIMEYYRVLAVQIRFESFSLQNGLELLQKRQGMLCARNVFEGCIDEPLHHGLLLSNVDVVFKKVAVECVLGVVQQIISFSLHVIHQREELSHQAFHTLHLVALQCRELNNRCEHVHELLNTLAIQIKLAKNAALIEIKLLHFGLTLKLFLRDTIQLLIGIVQPEAHFKPLQKVLRILVPKLDLAALRVRVFHVSLACLDHLVRNFDEESCHVLLCAVVARNSEHHLDVVHERR